MDRKIAFVFPGQGTQKVGMLSDVYEKSEIFKGFIKEISEWTEIDFFHLLYENNKKIDKTECTQVALLGCELGLLRILKKNNITPLVNAGYSLGEFAALVSSSVITEREASLLVKERGNLIAQACKGIKGAMAAVLGLKADVIERIIKEFPSLSIANYNTETNISISGLLTDIEKVSVKLKDAGARHVVLLNVSGPFHSPLIKVAGVKFEKETDKYKFQPPQIPYYPNVTAEEKRDASGIESLLCRQIYYPVKWLQTMDAMIKSGINCFIEVGYGSVLRGFLKTYPGIELYGMDTFENIENLLKKLC